MIKYYAILLSLVALCACGGEKNSAVQDEGPSQQAYGVIISESQMGQSDWLLTTKRARFFDEEKLVDLDSPVLLFNKNGKEDSNVSAKEGRYDMQESLITMIGDVKGVSEKEDVTVKTEKIYYDINRKVIWTDNDVKVTRGGITVNGKGIKANADLSEIEIIKQQTQLPTELKELKTAVRDYENKI